MAVGFDKWLFLKVIQFFFVISCLVCKAVTDDEESRLFLYLQKLSREWPFLTSVTWDRVGSAVAAATYGGYLIITLGMVIGKIMKELPTKTRAMERFFLTIGAILFIVIGGLAFAALESIPPGLVDNAAVLGTLSIVTGLLFLIDLAAPCLKDATKQSQTSAHLQLKPLNLTPEIYTIENGSKKDVTSNGNSQKNGKGILSKKSKNEKNNNHDPKKQRFDIYGSDKDEDQVEELPVRMEKHSPVFSRVHKPSMYGQYDNVSPSYLRFKEDDDDDDEPPPSTPGDPGYVQYTAKRWGQHSQKEKTPRNSPTEV